jgi:micrococcal nuclease
VDTVDRYGRTIGEIYLPDESNLNKQIVGAGYAWQYKRYSKDSEYGEFEAGARAAKRGLWQGMSHIPPWDLRKG